jgi:hypothetical protein
MPASCRMYVRTCAGGEPWRPRAGDAGHGGRVRVLRAAGRG